MIRSTLFLIACSLAAAPLLADADNPNRVEKQRADLTGAPGMEVVNSITTYRKGEGVRPHFHHGVESAFVVQGTMIQRPGKPPERMETGTVLMNARGKVHGDYVIVGDTPLILFSVHAVDKGQPLYDWVK